MTSPVDTSVKYMHSTMSGAPVLLGQAGSLIALLDACLINGFDLKTPTSLVVAGGVATLTYSGGHSAEKESVILVEGVTGALAALNGEQKVTFKSATEIKFATAAANGNAAGSISFKMAPCGWTKVYAAANKAVYKSADVQSNGHFLWIDDSDPIHTRVRGYESMTAIDTGTGPFPTDTQMSNAGATTPSLGGYWSKGMNASSTNPIGWTFFGDTRIFMYGPMTYQSQLPASEPTRNNYSQSHLRGFGDPVSIRPSGDPYGTTLACGGNSSHNSANSQGSYSLALDGLESCIYSPRPITGLGSAEQYYPRTFCNPGSVELNSGTATSYLGSFPSPVDGALRLSQRYLRKRLVPTPADYAPRAVLPGLLYVPQSSVFSVLPPRTLIQGAAQWAGRALVAYGCGPYSTDVAGNPDGAGLMFVDVTGPWR
jgi:hypothetical protein